MSQHVPVFLVLVSKWQSGGLLDSALSQITEASPYSQVNCGLAEGSGANWIGPSTSPNLRPRQADG